MSVCTLPETALLPETPDGRRDLLPIGSMIFNIPPKTAGAVGIKPPSTAPGKGFAIARTSVLPAPLGNSRTPRRTGAAGGVDSLKPRRVVKVAGDIFLPAPWQEQLVAHSNDVRKVQIVELCTYRYRKPDLCCPTRSRDSPPPHWDDFSESLSSMGKRQASCPSNRCGRCEEQRVSTALQLPLQRRQRLYRQFVSCRMTGGTRRMNQRECRGENICRQ